MPANHEKFEALLTKDLPDFLPPDQLGKEPSGVYCFFDAAGNPLYIGQSIHIKKRVQAHRRTKKWVVDALDVRALPLPDFESRLILETVLILKHRPRHNRSIKIGLAADGRLRELQFLRAK